MVFSVTDNDDGEDKSSVFSVTADVCGDESPVFSVTADVWVCCLVVGPVDS